jgi:integrase/recombinase XerD
MAGSKGQKRREVLLPPAVGRELLAMRGTAGDDEPVFQSRQDIRRNDPPKHPRSMSMTSVTSVVKRAANRAGVNPKLSLHGLRQAHAIDRGATLPVMQTTLGFERGRQEPPCSSLAAQPCLPDDAGRGRAR